MLDGLLNLISQINNIIQREDNKGTKQITKDSNKIAEHTKNDSRVMKAISEHT